MKLLYIQLFYGIVDAYRWFPGDFQLFLRRVYFRCLFQMIQYAMTP